jgi:hypothetical protein
MLDCTVFKGVESDVLRMCSDVCCTGSSGLPVLPTCSPAFMKDKKYWLHLECDNLFVFMCIRISCEALNKIAPSGRVSVRL